MIKSVFFGASTVEGIGASSPEKRFSTLVCRALGWDETNLGIGGTSMTGRDDKGMVIDEESGIGRIPDILHADPAWVVILYGANDFASSKPLGGPEQFQQGTFYWDYDTALRGLIENLPNAQIILMTLVYRADADTPNALGLTLENYNDSVRRLATRYSLKIVDAGANAGINSHNFAQLSADEAHLNDDGHQRLAASVIECLSTDRCE